MLLFAALREKLVRTTERRSNSARDNDSDSDKHCGLGSQAEMADSPAD